MVQVAQGSPPISFWLLIEQLLLQATALPCPVPSPAGATVGLGQSCSAPWEERATCASLGGAVPEVLSCPQSWMGRLGFKGCSSRGSGIAEIHCSY